MLVANSTRNSIIEGVLGVMILGGGVWAVSHQRPQAQTVSVTSTTATPIVQADIASFTSPTPTATEEILPATARAVVENFYTAYKAKDRDRLQLMFSQDQDTDSRAARTQLFGSQIGKRLFEPGPSAGFMSSYVILDSVQRDTTWAITIQETRLSGTGDPSGIRTILLILVPSGNSWLVDAYAKEGMSGKYSGFLFE